MIPERKKSMPPKLNKVLVELFSTQKHQERAFNKSVYLSKRNSLRTQNLQPELENGEWRSRHKRFVLQTVKYLENQKKN